MSQFYAIEKFGEREVVFVPDGDVNKVEQGVVIKLINDPQKFIDYLNKEYSTALLHYQSEDRIDVQRLLVRTVRKYLEESKK